MSIGINFMNLEYFKKNFMGIIFFSIIKSQKKKKHIELCPSCLYPGRSGQGLPRPSMSGSGH